MLRLVDLQRAGSCDILRIVSDHAPTQQQQKAIDAFLTGGSVKITAAAGTGKTTTLRHLATAAPDRKGVYVAYNKAIQEDANGTFPTNVECRTSHALANRAIRSNPQYAPLMNKLGGNRMSPVDTAKALRIPFQGFVSSDGEVALKGYQVAGIAAATVGRFANSSDDEVQTYHVPRPDGLTDEQAAELRTFVLRFARAYWADVQNPNGVLTFTHDHYRKIWALTRPRIDADFILYDEAQDAQPVMSKIVTDQQEFGTQIVMVGDESQAIYGWTGAVDAMAKFNADHEVALTQSFRFGPAVAEQANYFLTFLSAPIRVQGFEKLSSVVAPAPTADAILCRTNAGVIQHAMEQLGLGKKVAIVGGTTEIKKFVEAAEKLMSGKATTHPDLVAFKNWEEVVEYAQSDEGADLRVMVKLIAEHGTARLLEVCEQSTNEKTADVVVSTAHKAKGREWDTVKIATDFRQPDFDAGETLSRAEAMLAYVAVTRAKLHLDNAGLAWAASLA